MKAKLTLIVISIIGIMLLLGPTSKATAEEGIIEDGNYIISSAINNNLVLTVGGASQDLFANIEIATRVNLQCQKFNIKYLSDGYYKIEAIHSGKVLDVYAAGKTNGTNVDQYPWNDTGAQKWKIEKTEDGYYSFVSQCNGLYLDIYAGENRSGANVQMYLSNQTKAQKFKLEKLDDYVKERTLEDGVYSIHMSSNQSKIVQVLNNQKTNEAPVGIWDYNNNITQKFYFKYLEDGYYQIKSVYSEKVLDVYASAKYDNARVNLYDWNNTDAQKWIIRLNNDSTYSIISKCNGLFLDVYGGFTERGSKLHMYSDNGTMAQKFIIQQEEEIIPTKSVEDGIYIIKTSYDTSKVLEIQDSRYENFANVQLGTNRKMQNQKFRIEQIQETGYYKITAIDSGKMLDVYASGTENFTNVDQYTWNDTDAQKWIIKANEDNTYTIYSKSNELALDIYGASTVEGANVQIYTPNNTNAQKFIFEQVQIFDDGVYEIETKLQENQVIDIRGGSTENVTQVQLWEASNVKQQKFNLVYNDDSYYTITAQHSNKVISAGRDGSIYQYEYVDDIGQKWKIREAGNGYYYIYSELNNQYLTVYNDFAQNGNIIIGTAKNEKDAQKFKITNEIRTYFKEGSYGKSGLAVVGDPRGKNLKYYKFGKGPNVLFATYSIHGFEDNYAHDGTELTYIAEKFKNYLQEVNDADIFYEWQIYLFPTLNPDGQVYGWTNDGPGRTTLVSTAPNGWGIDMNRNWQIDGETYIKYKESRNYNGTAGFQTYETIALRDFLMAHRSINGQTILVDLHGWLNETMGDNELGEYYRNEYNMTKHIKTYGIGYLVNWARSTLGVSKNARSVLVELPPIYSHQELIEQQFAEKYINATMKMLKEITTTRTTYSLRKTSKSITKTKDNENTQYQVALAGAIKNEMPQENEVQKITNQVSNEEGIYITETSKKQFQEILEECNIKAFSIDINGYLVRNYRQIENELEKQLENMIVNGKRYIIDISDSCYIIDEVSSQIIEYPFVEMDSLQICQPFVDENDVLLFINSNKKDKIEAKEIIETILQY